jgi:hypothetical protein
MNADFVIAEPYGRRIPIVESIDGGQRLDFHPEHQSVLNGVLVQEEIRRMEMNRHAERPFRARHARHVIDVSVCEQNVPDRQASLLDDVQQIGNLVAGVDDKRFASSLARDDEAVLVEGRNGPHLEQHRISERC